MSSFTETKKENESSQTKLYEQAYEALIGQISSGAFKLGDRLPSENELAVRFHMSRPTIRKALSRLQADGIIIARRGSGNYISAQPTSQIKTLTPGSGNIAEMIHGFEIRIILEGEAAALAAERRTQAEVIQLEHILQNHATSMRESLKSAHNADFEFHTTIAEACRNPLIVETIKTLNHSVMSTWLLWNGIASSEYHSIQERVLNEHKKVFEAIRDQDSEGAKRNMRAHISNGRERILKTSNLSSLS